MVDAQAEIPPLVDEYMALLGLQGEGPVVEVKDNLGSPWLGRTTFKGNHKTGIRIWIEVQARALSDKATLEKIIAHEMAHYAEIISISERDLALMRYGIGKAEHGERFWRFANVINEAKGRGFVTKTSDESYELAENVRPYFVLIENLPDGRFTWKWAAKRTPAIDGIISRAIARGESVLAETTSDLLLSGAKMGKGKIGASVAKPGSDKEELLRELFEKANT